MASLDDLLCLEHSVDGDADDRADVEVLQATLRSLENLPPPPPPVDRRLMMAGPEGNGLSSSVTVVSAPWFRRPIVCKTLNGDNDRRILDNLLAVDAKCRGDGPPIDYFEAGLQPDIQPYMRDMVTSWMLEVCEVERCADEVFPLSVSYLDRFLASPAAAASRRGDVASAALPSLRRSQLQLVAAACMFLASKYRDTVAIPATQLVMYTDFSVTLDQLLECELMVLQAIGWELSLPTPHDFFDHLLRRLPLTAEQRTSVRRHAHTFAAMCITDATFLRCPTSTMAAACVSAALSGLMGRRWCSDDEVGVLANLERMTSLDAVSIRYWQNTIEQLLNNYCGGPKASEGACDPHRQQQQQLVAGTSPDADGPGSKLGVVDHQADVVPCDPPVNGCFQRELSTPADVREICLND